MNKKILASILIIAVAVVLIGAGTISYFNDVETSKNNIFIDGTIDLKIRHNPSDPWTDGVTDTWYVPDMKPGDDIPQRSIWFKNFGTIQTSTMTITCNYTVTEESPQTEADTDPNTDQHPDEMAKHMIITYIHYRNDLIDIDCLTGKNYTQSPIEDWRINDTDSDGIITLYDLKQDPLINLPSPDTQPNKITQLDMALKFDIWAGDDFQGDTFNLTLIFTLNQ
jgi:predicted ribosomally synthesized peptide with SipW-like signal peptide